MFLLICNLRAKVQKKNQINIVYLLKNNKKKTATFRVADVQL